MTVQKDDLIAFVRTYKLFWITVCSLLFLNAAFYGIFIRNQQKQIVDLQQSYAQNRRKVLGGGVGKTDLRQLVEARNQLSKFRGQLPERKSLSRLVAELNQVLNRFPVSVGKISFKPEREDTLDLWQYRSDLSITGPYPLLKKVLAGIQKLPSLFAIENLSISEGRGKDMNLEMKLTVSLYLI